MKNPLVSVVIPTYNNGEYLPYAINSVLGQTYKNIECVIVDDGSTDDTELVGAKFSEHDKRVRYLKHGHGGMVTARNLGCNSARGEILAHHDADDMAMPDWIERCVKYFPKYDVVYHGIYVNMWQEEVAAPIRKYHPAEPFDLEKLKISQYIPGVCLFKKSLWSRHPFSLDTQYAFDYAMHQDWTLAGAKYKNLDIGLYDYIRRENSSSIQYERLGLRKSALKKIEQKWEKASQ